MFKPLMLPSPNKKYSAVLTYLGEIQPDHGYYSLSISSFPHVFENRVFGRVCMWSPESRFLAVQEWKEPLEGNPPKLYLLLIIDVLTRRECVISNIDGSKGNILPEGFIGESLMYTVIYYGQFGITKNFESKFQYLDGWQNLR
ncbi:MAG: hypothetical protein ABI621_09820 [Chloroflexota bacterium]